MEKQTDIEAEHSKYLEDNSDMIWGTDFLYTHPDWYVVKSKPDMSGSLNIINKTNNGLQQME